MHRRGDEKEARAFDPEWIAHCIEEQHPDRPEVAEAMRRCTMALDERPGYTRFVDSRRANKPGAAWQFGYNLELVGTPRGWLILDVLEDGRVGGVEFVDEVPGP